MLARARASDCRSLFSITTTNLSHMVERPTPWYHPYILPPEWHAPTPVFSGRAAAPSRPCAAPAAAPLSGCAAADTAVFSACAGASAGGLNARFERAEAASMAAADSAAGRASSGAALTPVAASAMLDTLPEP